MFHIGTATGLYLYEINFITVVVLFSFVRWSVRCSRKRGHGRGAGKQSLLFLQVLERWIDGEMESLNVARGPHGRSPKEAGSTKQVESQERE